MPFKRADSPIWYAEYRDAEGRRVRRSTETTSRKEAKELEAKWKLEAREQRLWGVQPSRMFDEMLERYFEAVKDTRRGMDRDVYYAVRLRQSFGGRALSQIKRQDVRAYIEQRKKQGIAAGTINRETGLLSSMFNYARTQWDWEIPNPAQRQRLKEPEGRKRFATVAEARMLIAAAEKHDRAPYLADLIRLALNTGCRKGELLGLTWERVDLRSATLRLGGKDTKNGKARMVPLNAEARAALLRRANYRAEHCPGGRWVFSGKGGERLASINSSWPKVREEAGLEDFHFHDLRHTCGSWLVQAGVQLAEVKEILGHSTIRMTERYAHMAPENLRAAVDRLPSCPNSVPVTLQTKGGTTVSA
jgi:integrase